MSKEWFILQFKPNAHHQANTNVSRKGFGSFVPSPDTTTRNLSRFIYTSN